MTLPFERARTRRPVTWLTIIGVLLLPVLIGGVLVAALYNPAQRLDNMTAAIVNNDQPVKLNGQLVPLGRQLTAGLVKGTGKADSNLDWTISNTKDAASGLADGTYRAVVTIPKDFSADALSSAQALSGKDTTARRATIHVQSAADARVIDDAITAQLAQTAASSLGSSLSQSTLQNVFVSFTTLGDQLGKAADGASALADGAGKTQQGTVTLADGLTKLSTGAGTLADGASGIGAGVGKLADGAGALASGAKSASAGLGTWAAGAQSAASGLTTWAGGADTLAAKTAQLAQGLKPIADGLATSPQIPQQVVNGVNAFVGNKDKVSAGIDQVGKSLDGLAASCAAEGGSQELCKRLAAVAAAANGTATTPGVLPPLKQFVGQADVLAKAVDGLAQLPAAGKDLVAISGGLDQISGGMNGLAAGANDAAAGVTKLADGASGAADGIGTLADGAGALASGASQAASGAGQWAAGAHTWATGAGQTATGAGTLADGVGKLASGADGIANGLHTASGALPHFTDTQAKDLAHVVSDPVTAGGAGGTNLFGASAIPLLAMLALWFGGLASFVALRAVTHGALASRRPSVVLALRALAPAAAIGAAQGLLVAGIVQLAASYSWGTWWVFAAVCVVAGVAFAAVNQALVAVFGGAGRWIAAGVGVLAVATSVISTVPAVLVTVAGLVPTAPALSGGLAALTGTAGVGAGIAGLVIWAVLGVVATTLAVMRRRTTSVKALVSPAPAA